MAQALAVLRLWGSRLLWLVVAGALTVLLAFIPTGLIYGEYKAKEDARAADIISRQPGDLFRIEPWEKVTGTERPWHWSVPTYAGAVRTYLQDLLAGNPQYQTRISPVANRSHPILPELRKAWPRSVSIFAVALVGGVLLGILLGSLAAGRRLARNLSLGVSVGFMAIPDFYLVMLGQFATILTYNLWGFRLWTVGVPGGERHWVLPILALSILPIGYTARLMGGALDEIMQQDYIRTARSKGIQEWRIIFGHAFKNALPQVLNGLPVMINATLSSLVVVELLTSWPGMGRMLQPPPDETLRMVNTGFWAAPQHGQPEVLATVGLVFCVWFVLLNGLAHTIRLLASPRLREVEK